MFEIGDKVIVSDKLSCLDGICHRNGESCPLRSSDNREFVIHSIETSYGDETEGYYLSHKGLVSTCWVGFKWLTKIKYNWVKMK